MTDSTMNANSGEGALDVGGTDELFGNFEGEFLEEESEREPAEETIGDGTDSSSETVEDQTAAAVFGELQDSVSDSGDVDDVLDDESPDDIIASADEPEPEPVDDDLLVDEDELADLLLTDRTKDQEFLWVETSSEDDDRDESDSEVTEPGDAADDAVDEPAHDPAEADELIEDEEPAEADADAIESTSEADATESDAAAESDALKETDDATDTAVDTETDLAEDAETDDATDAPLFGDEAEDGDATDETSVARDDGSTSPGLDLGDETAADADEIESTTEETALVADDSTDVPATTDDEDEASSGFLGWLRSKLGGLF